ncbi:hypothetical protein FHL15_004774 [Xylaria flabelliformis]|uniref:Rhodopsin domain-containing protein n=1 Tax=Xylaria flabelliformis TaxID=2512241 RepID=A0A553I293_9PEZI|nr:hypothetical protein FHL15_004774 [Xylaria flabelliformis]
MSADVSSDENVRWRLIVFASIFTPLQIAIVSLRFYARSLTHSPFNLGDALVLVALLGALVQGGVGYHVSFLVETSPETVTTFFKYLVAISSWYWVTISISKLAVCLLYRSLFPQRAVFVTLCITATILISTSLATFIATLAACRPFSANWGSLEVQNAHCINKESLYVWGTFPNIVTDVLLLVIPLPIVWKLQATKKVKWALSVTFVVGGTGLIASILRFASFANTSSFTDATFNAVELIAWTVAEPGIYLISASLLVLRPLLDKVRPSKRNKGFYSFDLSTSRKARATPRTLGTNDDDFGRCGGIALVQRSTHGRFEQLEDRDDRPHETEGITVITDIQQTWNASDRF